MSSIPLYLVRHGEAEAHWGQSADPGLSKLGHRQADDCARELAPRLGPGTALFSSPLARALQTAEPLARRMGVDVSVSESFREIPAPVPLSERRDWLRGFMREAWTGQPDSLLNWRQRLLEALHATSTPSVIFTHFLVINAVVGHSQGSERTLSFWPDNASVTEIQLADGQLTLRALGRAMETVVN
ncbi:histidine phosphatase family protein [Chromatocurvus halotolerans]|uniref:Putative phosphoglycerate mutase n=1 Tax=Chromatocurvus halotolerans TaxID=1132028 RepID=A0A4R2KC62_9GAMM|nr:histidine phosphatase family protein [Chromatocurvus halotolerans]TCO71073.1 putative phosphoglycerate mutase [Chromatocurvus halotolerans]